MVAAKAEANLFGVQYRLEPSATFVVRRPSVEVDNLSKAPELLPTNMSPRETDVRPVPPLATDSVPTQEGANVCTPPAEVIVRLMFASEVEANVCVAPV